MTQTNSNMTKRIKIQVIDYPNSLQSAVYGLKELFIMANKVTKSFEIDVVFDVEILPPNDLGSTLLFNNLIILPPSVDGSYYLSPDNELVTYLQNAFAKGTILCSVCAGSFILAETGLINNRTVTTHWGLGNEFSAKYPNIDLQTNNILIDEGEIITAGGLMSWLDLGLEIVAKLTKPHVMRELGRMLIVDTGKREQRYYQSFTPIYDHGNDNILAVQQYIHEHYNKALTVASLASSVHMTQRTFLRQFSAATALKPIQYIQRVRVQKACQLLERTNQPFEQIVTAVGYEEANSFRKVFSEVMGLTPT